MALNNSCETTLGFWIETRQIYLLLPTCTYSGQVPNQTLTCMNLDEHGNKAAHQVTVAFQIMLTVHTYL